MAIKVLHGGEDLNAAVFGGRMSNAVINYMQNQVQQYAPYLKDNAFLMQSIQKMQEFTSEAYQRSREAIANMLGHSEVVNEIRSLTTLKEIQNAPPIMQRYIMAHTPVRSLFNKGLIDGYEGSYNNIRGNAIGEELYEWRRVHNGMINFVEKETETGEVFQTWTSTTYYDRIPKDDKDLTFLQRCAIHDTYDVIDKLFEDCDSDMTSRLNNSL